MKIAPVAKAVVGAVGLVTTVLTEALTDNVLDLNEGASLASTLVVAAGTVWAVWRVPNKTQEN